MHDRRLAARAGELKPSAVRELLKHSKLPGVISLSCFAFRYNGMTK